MAEFETIFKAHQGPVERFVKFRIGPGRDAETILQETYLTAVHKFHTLRDPGEVKAWILAIARDKCNEFSRERKENVVLTVSRWGPVLRAADMPEVPGHKHEQLKQMHDVYGYSQTEIETFLGISKLY